MRALSHSTTASMLWSRWFASLFAILCWFLIASPATASTTIAWAPLANETTGWCLHDGGCVTRITVAWAGFPDDRPETVVVSFGDGTTTAARFQAVATAGSYFDPTSALAVVHHT